ncbi:MAG: hypothetical protein IIA87_05665 [Nanoarchaeota archaeon]|nr:hypothetical protein [Nanoarchaeota archaeon]
MISWVIIVIVLIALFIFLKTTGFRYGRLVTWIVGVSLVFFIVTFLYTSTKQGLNLATFDGFVSSISFYFSWLGNFFGTTASITGNTIKDFWTNVSDFSQ